MKIHMFANNSCIAPENVAGRTPREFLSSQLARVIAINMMCLVVFVAFCTVMTFDSPSLLLSDWNEHRAASVVAIMLAVVLIPGVVELAVSRWGPWRV